MQIMVRFILHTLPLKSVTDALLKRNRFPSVVLQGKSRLLFANTQHELERNQQA